MVVFLFSTRVASEQFLITVPLTGQRVSELSSERQIMIERAGWKHDYAHLRAVSVYEADDSAIADAWRCDNNFEAIEFFVQRRRLCGEFYNGE